MSDVQYIETISLFLPPSYELHTKCMAETSQLMVSKPMEPHILVQATVCLTYAAGTEYATGYYI